MAQQQLSLTAVPQGVRIAGLTLTSAFLSTDLFVFPYKSTAAPTQRGNGLSAQQPDGEVQGVVVGTGPL